jgi:hypothetical protein
MYWGDGVTHTYGPWFLEPRLGHAGYGAPRWIICAPDYNHRIAVVSLNGAAQGDQNIALDNANLLNAAVDLLEVSETFLRLTNTVLTKEVVDIEELKLALEFYKPQLTAVIDKAKGKIE